MNTIEEWKKDFKEYVNCLSLPRDDYNGIMEYIDEVPAVEIATKLQPNCNKLQQTQGEWIKQHGKSYMLVTDEGTFVGEFTKCPKCLYDKARGSKFCPNCGASMKGGTE